MIAGVETGGTKVVCAIAHAGAPGEPLEVRRFPTTTPAETTARINDYFAEAAAIRPLDALGVVARFVVPPVLEDSGLVGALASAADLLR